jgi:hypothetical protein
LPSLVKIEIQNNHQKPISIPPKGYGDFHPFFLQKTNTLTWIRSTWEQHDVWISKFGGASAKKYIENIDDQESISWFDPK